MPYQGHDTSVRLYPSKLFRVTIAGCPNFDKVGQLVNHYSITLRLRASVGPYHL